MTKATTPLNSGTGCPSCGQDELLPDALQDARQKVQDLEGQVSGLNTQATQMGKAANPPAPRFRPSSRGVI